MPTEISSAVLKALRKNQRFVNKINHAVFFSHGSNEAERKHSHGRLDHGLIRTALSDAKTLVESMPLMLVRKSLKTVMGKELKTLSSHFSRIIGSGHPIVNTAKQVLQAKEATHTRKLIVLLMSDIVSNLNKSQNSTKQEERTNSQSLSLAELTEFLHIAFLLQRGLVDVIQHQPDIIELGNKMSVLGGDFLLAQATLMLAQLENSAVLGLMAAAIRDMSRGMFAVPEQRDTHLDEQVMKTIPTNVDEWRRQNSLAHASLLANACRSGAVLQGMEEECGDVCADFGHHLSLAQQARSDIDRISTNQPNDHISEDPSRFFSELCSLPSAVMGERVSGGREWFDPFLVDANGKMASCDEARRIPRRKFSMKREEFLSVLVSDSVVLKRSEEVCHEHVDAAIQALKHLPQSSSRKCLENLALSYT